MFFIKSKTKSFKRGFTLIELIVVIAILAILASLAVPSFSSLSTESKDNVCFLNRKIITREIISYQAIKSSVDVDSIMEGYKNNCPASGTYSYHEDIDGFYIVCSVHRVIVGTDWDAVNDKFSSFVKDHISGGGSPYDDRGGFINKYASTVGLDPVSEKDLIAADLSSTNLYWRPYYLGNLNTGLVVYYAGNGSTGTNGWRGELLSVNGQLYKTTASYSNVSYMNRYSSYEAVIAAIENGDLAFVAVE